tara:strand:+ start:1237 stop:2025 length:789 start_codon:yes stop_codon:yes gene_type:complete
METSIIKNHIDEIDNKGWTLMKGCYNSNLIDKINQGIEKVKPTYHKIQEEAGLSNLSHNSTHHTFVSYRGVLDLLDPNPTHDILTEFFGGKYILNTMGAAWCDPRGAYNYTQKIHRDIRSYSSSSRLYLNGVILLDDTNEENGATHMIIKEYNTEEKPSDDYFMSHSERICGKKGDIILFDGNMWHSAGVNQTDKTRRIFSQLFTKPFVKQQMDYPRALGLDFKMEISENLAQILGYNSMTPSNLREFYKPKEQRFYQSDQG